MIHLGGNTSMTRFPRFSAIVFSDTFLNAGKRSDDSVWPLQPDTTMPCRRFQSSYPTISNLAYLRDQMYQCFSNMPRLWRSLKGVREIAFHSAL